MGIYAVTGGSSGIGAKTVEYLRAQGHLVYNIDLKNSDNDRLFSGFLQLAQAEFVAHGKGDKAERRLGDYRVSGNILV